MPDFFPRELAAWTGGHWTATPDRPLRGFAIDTRRLQPGEVFVALATERRDGHGFLAAARAAGAPAALVARPNPAEPLPQLVVADPLPALHAVAREHRRRFPGLVVGISGSVGKTSTKELVTRLLGGEAAGVLATEGNLNNHLGVPLTLARLAPERHRFAVIEAGISQPGEMAVLASMLAPDLALITSVAPAHLEDLGSEEQVAEEKARLLTAVRPGGGMILAHSCLRFAAFRALAPAALVVERTATERSEGTSPAGAFQVVQGRAETMLRMGGAENVFMLPRVSDGMADNAALAIAAVLSLGVPPHLVQERLAGWRPARLRGEWRREGAQWRYLDCYNANPASMADALQTFAALAPAEVPRWYVLGGMEALGPDAPRYHRELGARLRLRPLDHVFVLGPHAEVVRQAAIAAGNPGDCLEVVASLEPVRARLAGFAGAVFVKGSRRYRLEELWAEPASTEEASC